MELEAKGKRARASRSSSSSSILAGGDRLSSLPDCLIHHIMSFMKARQVVQTCVLSTRWEHLWRSVPCLNIDQEEFKTAGSSSDDWEKFEDFTDHLLIPNNISIALLDTFRLHVSPPYQYYRRLHATRWIRHGIKYSTQDAGIQRKGLSYCSWRLKRLHLSNLDLDARFMNHVSSGCQFLEDLELNGCNCACHDITSHTLKKLVLKKCSGLSAITCPTLRSLTIHAYEYTRLLMAITAPSVDYLLLDVQTCRFEGDISLGEMPSLAKASIDLRSNSIESKVIKNQSKLLCSVSNVTSLVLSGFQIMVLGEEPMAFPNFSNLRTLLLDNCDLSDNFQILGHFLQSSLNLNKLTLRHCKFSKDPKKKKGSKAKLNKGCLNQFNVSCKNLKYTEIVYEDDDVKRLVELLLSISGSLPKNNIKLTKVDSPDH